MFRSVKVTMMLADYAQAANGKLTIVGGGWTVYGNPQPFAIALSVEMPWDAAGVEHSFRLDLVDNDGIPVEVPLPPDGQQTGPLVIQGPLPLVVPPGTKRGTPLTTGVAMNFSPPPPIPAGGRYEFRLEVDGQTHEDWRLGFSTPPDIQSKAA
jgi:Family of unknown function (DUF6941)